MTHRAISHRLAALEARHRRQTVCQTCRDHPLRIVCIDEASDTVRSETYPETGCPDCGAAVWREIQIIGLDSEVMP